MTGFGGAGIQQRQSGVFGGSLQTANCKLRTVNCEL
jgi:hypothetical protein